jgi:GNAT superfamily N-acetyltransferase
MTLPATIRRAVVSDALAIADVKAESWRASYREFVPQSVLDAMNAESVRRNWLGVKEAELVRCGLVLDGGTALLGYSLFGAAIDATHGFTGQLYEIYLRPSALGQGFGAALFRVAAGHLHDAGHDTMIVWVFEANARARRFYERLGGKQIADASFVMELGGQKLREVAYGFRSLRELG